MPFVNGRFYMNPAQGRAVERARIAQATSDHPDSHPLDPDAHWVTINHRHVLINEAQQGPTPSRKAPHRMFLSANGLNFIKKHEAFSNKMYLDNAGNWTIGYGHKIVPGEDFSKGITQKEALELLNQDIQRAAGEVNAALKVPLDQNQFDALESAWPITPARHPWH